MSNKKLHVRFVSKSKSVNPPYKPQDLEPITIACLYRLYPWLLLLDQLLDKLMWHIDDVSLQLIYIILLCYSTALVVPKNTSLLFQAFDIWLGYTSVFILAGTMFYYNYTLWKELEQSEAPTIDEITHTLDSVLEKLKTVQNEVLGTDKVRKLTNINSQTFKIVALLTVIHLITVSFLDVRTYSVLVISLVSVFHSVYYQSTMKLLWRYLWIRRCYYYIWDSVPSESKLETNFQQYKVICESQVIPFPKSLQGLKGQELQVQLQMLILQDPTKIDPESDYVHVKIIEYNVDENERKWKQEGWTPKLLPYERAHFSNSFTQTPSVTPWKFHEELPSDWIWIESTWVPGSWQYCDAKWNLLGANDSIACFTRRRTWKRRAFKILT
ncbi:Pex32p [Kluyveromyces lactis]|uniref:KLLA0E24641p n=1 Tax=Kluyveromyces lactis (strain ATCC 8585 / CBS 2359 / DSM 70799 / NBRC 1267 / NRRL Y-1140 / WM37) TaxID=284590 RepID=Q6CLX7_KLULA|nr:uncharacterized protein KLLA0_E24641g [Kluyveromyces lactis]CAH00149.1 KLLA0E24641p [Kluyveromyces lactis]|eukprot:XP_455062.1 uncharacterized protein KLLA0_E24641g [Kluyveromyces lactis]